MSVRGMSECKNIDCSHYCADSDECHDCGVREGIASMSENCDDIQAQLAKLQEENERLRAEGTVGEEHYRDEATKTRLALTASQDRVKVLEGERKTLVTLLAASTNKSTEQVEAALKGEGE